LTRLVIVHFTEHRTRCTTIQNGHAPQDISEMMLHNVNNNQV